MIEQYIIKIHPLLLKEWEEFVTKNEKYILSVIKEDNDIQQGIFKLNEKIYTLEEQVDDLQDRVDELESDLEYYENE